MYLKVNKKQFMEKEHKILTPKQRLQRLPIAQIIYSLFDTEKYNKI